MNIFPNEIILPQKTIYRPGSIDELSNEVKQYGSSGIIVHGRSLINNGNLDKVLKQFSYGVTVEDYCRKGGEPTLSEVSLVLETARDMDAGWVVGIGGGSVLDLAKAVAGLINESEEPAYYQMGGEVRNIGVPFIAVPTTAGTGSEVTSNSVIINEKDKTKLSIRDKSFMARKVILDSELLLGSGKEVISYAAMDSLVQAYESFISKNSTWYSDNLSLKAIELVGKNIVTAYDDGEINSLGMLLLASYLGGMALSISRLGVIHGIAHPLGAIYNQPHGLICAVSLRPAIKLLKDSIGLKYGVLNKTLGGDLLDRTEFLIRRLNIVSPFRGENLIYREKIIEEALKSGSTAASPRTIDTRDIDFILKEIFK